MTTALIITIMAAIISWAVRIEYKRISHKKKTEAKYSDYKQSRINQSKPPKSN